MKDRASSHVFRENSKSDGHGKVFVKTGHIFERVMERRNNWKYDYSWREYCFDNRAWRFVLFSPNRNKLEASHWRIKPKSTFTNNAGQRIRTPGAFIYPRRYAGILTRNHSWRNVHIHTYCWEQTRAATQLAAKRSPIPKRSHIHSMKIR